MPHPADSQKGLIVTAKHGPCRDTPPSSPASAARQPLAANGFLISPDYIA
jgi:hypothetical protein